MKKRKKKKQTNWMLIIMSAILGVLVIGYIGVAIYFLGHFYGRTTVNEIDASYMSEREIKEVFSDKAREYSLTIYGRGGVSDVIFANDIDLTPDFENQFKELLASQNAFLWPKGFMSDSNFEVEAITDFSEADLSAIVNNLSFFNSANMVKPENAYLSDTYGDEGYYIVPEKEGSTPKKDAVMETLKEAISMLDEEVTLSDDCYEKAAITSDDEKLNAEVNRLNEYYKSNIYYVFGEDTIYVRDYIDEWLSDDGTTISLDESLVREFVNGIARKYDTFGVTRKFKSHTGETINVVGGTYGWWMNRPGETEELIAAIRNGESGQRTPVYYSVAEEYGEKDYGNSYVEVDLTEQHVYVFLDGVQTIDSDFVSGNISKGHGTHTGTYGITYKERDATLQGQGYSSPVSYWMPFNENEGLHDASWRSEFGGDIYLRNGSHGCINLPKKVAEKIYEVVYKDMPVIVYGGQTEVPAEELSEQEQLALLIQQGVLNPDGSIPEGSDLVQNETSSEEEQDVEASQAE